MRDTTGTCINAIQYNYYIKDTLQNQLISSVLS